ncbi:MAG: NAD(P)H-dependent FMN reductase [Granulosicoccus sp.]|jgi:NAD(P)H-dependent FMN reductase
MKLLAFAASSSKKSINKQLATYAASLIENADTEVVDLNDYELPLFSQDKEAELGQPDLARAFLSKITDADALIIAFAEHNGTYSAAYKNLFDWCSRINPKVFQNKAMVLLATSPGARGGASVLAAAVSSAPFFDGEVKASMSLPSFYDNFDVEQGCVNNKKLQQQLAATVNTLLPA